MRYIELSPQSQKQAVANVLNAIHCGALTFDSKGNLIEFSIEDLKALVPLEDIASLAQEDISLKKVKASVGSYNWMLSDTASVPIPTLNNELSLHLLPNELITLFVFLNFAQYKGSDISKVITLIHQSIDSVPLEDDLISDLIDNIYTETEAIFS